MSILFLIDNLLFRAIKGKSLLLAARKFLRVVCMCCLKVSPWSKITPRYLQCSDQGIGPRSVLLSAILYLSLLFCFKREKRMGSVLLTKVVTLHLANQIDSSLRCLEISKIVYYLFLLAASTQILPAKIAKWVYRWWGMSSMKILNDLGINLAPWRTSKCAEICCGSETIILT